MVLQNGHRLLALLHSVWVLRACELVLYVRVGDQDDRNLGPRAVGDQREVVGAAVDQQQVALLSHCADILWYGIE